MANFQNPKINTNSAVEAKLLSTEELRREDGTVPWGCTWVAERVIGIRNHLVFAPSEVIRSVVIHQFLHIIYPVAMKPSPDMPIRSGIRRCYPVGRHIEKEWIFRIEKRICGFSKFLELWEVSVDMYGDKWRRGYKKLKDLIVITPEDMEDVINFVPGAKVQDDGSMH